MYRNFLKNSILRGGAIFFIGGLIANILNYLYRILMGRMLGPEFFGELTAILSLIFILVVPSAPVQIAAARFSGVFQARDSGEKLKGLFGYLTRIFGLISLVLIILVFLFAGFLQDFLKLSSRTPIYFLSLIVAIMLIAGVSKGILQGLKRFSQLSLVFVLESAGRVGLAVIFVVLGFKMIGALGGFLIPLILGYFLTLYFLRPTLKNGRGRASAGFIEEKMQGKEVREIWNYMFFSLLAFLFLNILLNVDKILVKHYFPGFQAGIFAAFSTLGQAVFLAVSLMAGILFPIVVQKQAKNENYFAFLRIILLISFLIAVFSFLIFFFFSRELLLLFFGGQYLEGAPFLSYYGIVMGIFGFIFLLSYFFMALNKFKFLYILAAGTILEILLIAVWHGSFFQAILMFFIALLFAFSGMTSLFFLDYRDRVSIVKRRG